MLHKTTILLVLALAVAYANPEPVEAKKTDVKGYETDDGKEVSNFPVNGLPPLTYSSKKYTFHFEFISFYQAWSRCRAMGKRLAAIENYQDHAAYREAVAPYAGIEVTFWIAATNVGARSNDRQTFYWITNDRPVGYVNGYSNWLLGSAPNEADMCAATYLGSAVWVYGPCATAVSAYSCEESQDV